MIQDGLQNLRLMKVGGLCLSNVEAGLKPKMRMTDDAGDIMSIRQWPPKCFDDETIELTSILETNRHQSVLSVGQIGGGGSEVGKHLWLIMSVVRPQ